MTKFQKLRIALKKNKRSFLALFILIVVLVAVFLFFDANINPVILSMSEAEVRSLTTKAINSAVYSTMSDSTSYNELINIITDNDGKIAMLSANSLKINELARVSSKKSQESLDKLGEQGILIPIGSLTGSPILSGQGPNIRVEIVPIGSVVSNFISEFEEAGINQTRHKIYLELVTVVDIILPVSTASVETKTQVLICESILVGDVPSTYLKFNSGDGLLNLLP